MLKELVLFDDLGVPAFPTLRNKRAIYSGRKELPLTAPQVSGSGRPSRGAGPPLLQLLPCHYASRSPRLRPPSPPAAAVAAAGAVGPGTAAPWSTRLHTPSAATEPPAPAARTSVLPLEAPVGPRLRLPRACKDLQEVSQKHRGRYSQKTATNEIL